MFGNVLAIFARLKGVNISLCGLTKLMVSHDLLCSTATKQIAFIQRDSNSIPKFERLTDRCCQALIFKLETLDTILLESDCLVVLDIPGTLNQLSPPARRLKSPGLYSENSQQCINHSQVS